MPKVIMSGFRITKLQPATVRVLVRLQEYIQQELGQENGSQQDANLVLMKLINRSGWKSQEEAAGALKPLLDALFRKIGDAPPANDTFGSVAELCALREYGGDNQRANAANYSAALDIQLAAQNKDVDFGKPPAGRSLGGGMKVRKIDLPRAGDS